MIFFAILTTAVIVWALGFSLRSDRTSGLIGEHRYANRYNDATASREDHLG
jgi:hypothetical protein